MLGCLIKVSERVVAELQRFGCKLATHDEAWPLDLHPAPVDEIVTGHRSLETLPHFLSQSRLVAYLSVVQGVVDSDELAVGVDGVGDEDFTAEPPMISHMRSVVSASSSSTICRVGRPTTRATCSAVGVSA